MKFDVLNCIIINGKIYFRQLKLQKRRGESNLKFQFLGDKLSWFKNNLDPECEVYTPKDVAELIQRYLYSS